MIGWLKKIKHSMMLFRSNLLDYEWWRSIGINGPNTTSGVEVGPYTAMELPAFWRAINTLAGDIAKLPLRVVKQNPDGSREVDEDHRLNDLLTWKINDLLTTYHWKLDGVGHALTYGGWYSLVDRDTRGRVVRMQLLEASRMTVQVDNGVPVYSYNLPPFGITFPASDILHIRGMSRDGFDGYSAVGVGREAIGLGLAAQQFTGSFFGNSARPGVVLQHPGKLSPTAKGNIEQSWRAMYQGSDNQFRTGVLEEGMEAKTLTIPPADAQMAETTENCVRDAANLIGVPGHKLGGQQNTSYSSLEQENQAYASQVLDTWLTNIETEMTCKLLGPFERATRCIKFDRSMITMASTTDKATAHNIAITGGWKTPNEVRREENMAPIEGGDVLISMHAGKLETEDDDGDNGTQDDDGDAVGTGDESRGTNGHNRVRGGVVRRDIGNGVSPVRHNGREDRVGSVLEGSE